MAIKSIEVMNVMVFRRQWRNQNDDCKTGIKAGDVLRDAFQLEFCDGINVLIGENGVGKTTLLKMIYAATQWSNEQTDERKTNRTRRIRKIFVIIRFLTESTVLRTAFLITGFSIMTNGWDSISNPYLSRQRKCFPIPKAFWL